MKRLCVILIFMFCAPMAFAKSYVCEIMSDGTPRFGIVKMKIYFSYSGDSSSRFEFSIIETKNNSHSAIFKDLKVVYTHSANIHVGKYQGFKKFTPSSLFVPPQFFRDKISEIALRERSDRQSAVLALIGSNNSVYSCR